MSRAGAISAVVGGAAVLVAATVAGIAVVNAASATAPVSETRPVASQAAVTPVTPTPAPTRLALPDVKKPKKAPKPSEPTIITIPAEQPAADQTGDVSEVNEPETNAEGETQNDVATTEVQSDDQAGDNGYQDEGDHEEEGHDGDDD